jgi:2-amino-4-hydroxy-6-hydroxymethyldihydropteridine diphosphokinase
MGMIEVVLSLGCNLGDRAALVRAMEAELEGVLESPVRRSSLMETEPLDVTEAQPWYFNRLLRAGCSLSAADLLTKCHEIEARLGRTRPGPNAPRTADIDILLYGEVQLGGRDLTIPHPRLWERRFCLLGLIEIAPLWRVPGESRTAGALALEREPKLKDQKVRIVK